jgi:predicted DNA-binding protein (MmcQ/YjbR family)
MASKREAIRAFALSLPGAEEAFPWGERVVKVNKKVFVFLGSDDGPFSLSVKLLDSHLEALDDPRCAPTGYGLGRNGWITATYERAADVDVAKLRRWIAESFRNVAPKRVGALLEAPAAPASPAKKTAKKQAAKKPAPKKPARRAP